MKTKLFTLIRYAPFFILIPTLVLDIIYPDIVCIHETTDNIISVLLPMIFTILVIAISLPDKDIYGVSINEFRRYRVDNHFGFIEMIIITIIIFIIHTICSYFSYNLSIIGTYLLSLIYALLFVLQEVPVILEIENYLHKCIKKFFQYSNDSKVLTGLEGKENKKFRILKKFLFTQGYDSVFRVLKSEDKNYNQNILSNILTINIDFLRMIVENKEYFATTSLEKIDGIEIIDAVSMSIANLESLLDMDSDNCIIKIFNNFECYHWITRLVYALENVTVSLGMSEMFNNHMYSIHRQLLTYTDYNYKSEVVEMFVYKVLDNLMVNSVSKNEMWYLKLMRDSSYNSQFFYGSKKSHFILVVFYLFYMTNDDKRVSPDLKNKLEFFMAENSSGLNSDGISWNNLVAFQISNMSIGKIIMLLPDILKEYSICDFHFSWYYPPNRTSWCSSEGYFSKDYIINLWLEIVVYSINSYDYKSGDLKNVFEKLSIDEKRCFINEVSKHVEDLELVDFNQEHSILSYYKCREYKKIPFKKSVLIGELMTIRQDILSKQNDESYSDISITNEDYKEILNKLESGFMGSATDNKFFNKNISFERKQTKYFSTLCETKDKDVLIDMYISNFKYMIEKLIIDEVEKCNNSIPKKKMSDFINESFLENISNYNYKNNLDYIWYNYNLSDKYIESLNKIEYIDIFLDGNYYWKDDAIQFNIEIEKDKCCVRPLTSEEINNIIDKDYKIKDGLYKYSEYNDEKTSFYMTREKLYSILEKRYFYICLVFYVNIEIDYGKILLLVDDNKA